VAGARIELLGPVRALHEGCELKLGGPIARMILVAVALAGSRTTSDEELIDGVWGEDPPDGVVAALRVHISSLRSALMPAGLVVDRRGAGYVLSGVRTVDV
jgi:DNA-binding response OmpR family regulator